MRRLVRKLRVEMPWIAQADLPACRAWAELEILGSRAFAELDANGITNEAGEPRRLLGEFRQLRQAQLAYERELELTPAARGGWCSLSGVSWCRWTATGAMARGAISTASPRGYSTMGCCRRVAPRSTRRGSRALPYHAYHESQEKEPNIREPLQLREHRLTSPGDRALNARQRR